MAASRSPEEVFAHHGQVLTAGDVEGIVADYSDDAIVIAEGKVAHGKEGARDVFTRLLEQVPQAVWGVRPVFAEDVLYLEWSARSGTRQLEGVDTFVFRDGQIRVQTLWHTLRTE